MSMYKSHLNERDKPGQWRSFYFQPPVLYSPFTQIGDNMLVHYDRKIILFLATVAFMQ